MRLGSQPGHHCGEEEGENARDLAMPQGNEVNARCPRVTLIN
jgi:hypothetical protein